MACCKTDTDSFVENINEGPMAELWKTGWITLGFAILPDDFMTQMVFVSRSMNLCTGVNSLLGSKIKQVLTLTSDCYSINALMNDTSIYLNVIETRQPTKTEGHWIVHLRFQMIGRKVSSKHCHFYSFYFIILIVISLKSIFKTIFKTDHTS